MKKTKLLYSVCLLISCLLLSDSFAQDYASQWHLPEGAKARLGRGKLNNILFSPDGTRVAVPTSIGIWVYDAHTTDAVSLFSGIQTGEIEKYLPTKPPEALTFSADALMIASAHGNTIYVWDTATGTAFAMLDEHPDEIKGIALSPDSTKLATAGGDWTVRLWEVSTGKYLNSLTGHSGAVTGVAFSPDGKVLASAGSTLRLWDVDTGELLGTNSKDLGDLGSVDRLVFSPDGTLLVSGGGWDPALHLWDAETGILQQTLKGHTGKTRDIAFSSDGKILASVAADRGGVRLWDVSTRTELKRLPTSRRDDPPPPVPPILKREALKKAYLPNRRDDVYSISFSKDATHLVSASIDGSFHVWDVESGLYQRSLALGAHSDSVSVLAFSEDGKHLANNDGFEDRIRVWDVQNATQHTVLTPEQGDLVLIGQLTVSQGIKKVAGRDFEGTIRIWDAATAELLSTIATERMQRYWPLVLSPDGRFLAGRDRKMPVTNKIEFWQTDPGAHLFTLEGHTRTVTENIFSPDSKILASGGEDAVIVLWDVETGNPLVNLTGHTKAISALTFSADGKTLVSGAEDEIRLWDANTGALIRNLDTALNVRALAFSPDGKTLACGSGSMIHLWKLDTTFQPHAVLKGHHGSIDVLMFSPDGKTLASGGADGTILLWNIE